MRASLWRDYCAVGGQPSALDRWQELTLANREREEQQRKRDLEARAREKREFELERKALREQATAAKILRALGRAHLSACGAQLARDKAERAAKRPPAQADVAAAPAAAPAPTPAAAPKPAGEREAAAAAAAGLVRSYDEPELTLGEATAKLCALSDTRLRPAAEMLRKMVDNIAKHPADPKYRKARRPESGREMSPRGPTPSSRGRCACPTRRWRTAWCTCPELASSSVPSAGGSSTKSSCRRAPPHMCCHGLAN